MRHRLGEAAGAAVRWFCEGAVEGEVLPGRFRLLGAFQEEKGNCDEIAAVSICTTSKPAEIRPGSRAQPLAVLAASCGPPHTSNT